jgi:hypothetical protein
MLYDNGRWQIKPMGTLTHKVKFPGESEGSPWIQNCFRELENKRPYEPGKEDLLALSSIPHFDVEVGFRFSIKKVTQRGGTSMDDMMMDYEYEFRTTDETMVIIEGLL